jgi:hypothetical protein
MDLLIDPICYLAYDGDSAGHSPDWYGVAGHIADVKRGGGS